MRELRGAKPELRQSRAGAKVELRWAESELSRSCGVAESEPRWSFGGLNRSCVGAKVELRWAESEPSRRYGGAETEQRLCLLVFSLAAKGWMRVCPGTLLCFAWAANFENAPEHRALG